MSLEEMVTLPGKEPVDVSRDGVIWRAAVFNRLGFTTNQTGKIHQLLITECAYLTSELEKMREILRTIQYALARIVVGHGRSSEATTTTRCGSLIEAGVPEPQKNATLCLPPQLFSVL